jgi:predicted phage tail component-like protein
MLFNGIDLTPYFREKAITGRGILSRIVTLKEMPNRPGAYFQKKKRPVRVLNITGDVRADTPELLRTTMDELNGILDVPSPVPIVFPDEPNITYYGIPEAADDGEEYTFIHKGGMTILCPDPDKYGQTFTPSFSAGALAINHGGTVEAYPTMNVTMDVASPDLVLSNGADTLRIIYDFIIGDTLEINFKTRKVTINGVVNMPTVDLNNPNFFPLMPGPNNLTIVPATTATVTYREVFA